MLKQAAPKLPWLLLTLLWARRGKGVTVTGGNEPTAPDKRQSSCGYGAQEPTELEVTVSNDHLAD